MSVERFDAGFISTADAMAYAGFGDARELDRFVIDHNIPLLKGGGGKYTYRVHRGRLEQALMEVHSFSLSKARAKEPHALLTAWRSANGTWLALRNKHNKEVEENGKGGKEEMSLKGKMGSAKANANTARAEWEATDAYKEMAAKKAKK